MKMKIGDLVKINDLCRDRSLVSTIGTVVETGIKEEWHTWSLARVLTINGIVKFREDTPQLEVI